MFLKQITFLRPLILAKYKSNDQSNDLLISFFNQLVEHVSFDSENLHIFSCNSSSVKVLTMNKVY